MKKMRKHKKSWLIIDENGYFVCRTPESMGRPVSQEMAMRLLEEEKVKIYVPFSRVTGN